MSARKNAAEDPRPSLLILSFSDISIDARVKKQVDLFATRYRVTTCGFGAAVRDDIEHVRLDGGKTKTAARLQAVALRLRWYAAAYACEPYVRAARRALRGREFDAIITDDLEGVGVADGVGGARRTHADLHEYWPGVHDQSQAWVSLRQPYYRWMLRTQIARAASATTVSRALAERYEQEFGIACGVVHNAVARQDLTPTPVGDPVRLVHSGVAQPNRHPEVMMEAVAESRADVTLDLYLLGLDTPYGRSLEQLADRLGDRVTVHPPKPYTELLPTLNRYDIGIFVLPPTTTNFALALPNKFFDFVQARLGVIVGPSLEMASRVREYGLGAVTDGVDRAAVIETLDRVTRSDVEQWKRNADAAAAELHGEADLPVWERAVAVLATGQGGRND